MDLNGLRQRFKGRNAQNLTRNFSALAILQGLRYVIPLLVLPYVTPIIGLEHFGEIAISASLILVAQVFVNYSFSFMGARDIARNRDDSGKVSEIVSKTIVAYILIYILVAIVVAGVVFVVPKFRSISTLIAIHMTIPILSALVCEWFFQGMEQMQNITIANTLSRVIFVVLVFCFIKRKGDYLLFPLFEAVGHMFAACYSIFLMVRRYKCRIRIPSLRVVADYLAQGKDIFLNQSCIVLLNRMPNMLLGNFAGSASAGLFHAAFRLQEAACNGVDTLNRTFFPFLARRMDKYGTYRRINLIFASGAFAVLFIFAPFLIRLLYAADFAPAVRLLRILAFSILFLGISSAYGVNRLLLIGQERLVRNITFAVSGGGLVLLLVMIHFYAETGAAIAMVVVNAAMALSYFVASKRLGLE